VVPAAADDGVGAVLLAVPPVAFVPYQLSELPVRAVAIKALVVEPAQYAKLLTTGTAGRSFTTTVIFDLALSHPSALI
jgi:hypothetical protein